MYKGGDGHDVNNYRPISVLTLISKIIEKVLNKRIVNYLNKFNIIAENQYGFQTGKSTADAVEALTSVVVDKLDAKCKCLTVFLDLKKAFDTVSIPILVKKLECIGFRDVPLELLKDYLNNRTQRVKIGDMVSECETVGYGVPQGSVLGPTLFLVYLNDLCSLKIRNARIFSYADDTAVVFSNETWDSVKADAEAGLRVIADWLRNNLLTLNTHKTNFITFSLYNRTQPEAKFDIKVHHCSETQVNCDCPMITKVDTVKYLGVMLDQRLSWKSHVELVASRLRKLIYIFKILRHVTTKTLIDRIYVALAESISIYCITVWGGAAKTKLIEVERAQRALLKVSYFKKRRYSTQSLYTLADTLSIRRLFILHIVMQKHNKIEFDANINKKRRNFNVAKVTQTRTKFAHLQFQYLSSFLYNKCNKILKIYSLNQRECKRKVAAWLKTLDYDETEFLLKRLQ